MDNYSIPKKLPFSKRFLSAKIVLSYIFDYAIIIILAVGFFILDAVEPYHQQFSLKNYTLHYTMAVHERVPVPALLIICFVAPAIIIAVYTLVIDGIFSHSPGGRKRYTLKSRLWELNCGILGLLLAVGASFVITGTLKNAIGKPRPDLIDRCQPDPATMESFLLPNNFSLASHAICQQKDNAILKDGFRSFPSGHSSSAWSGLFYLSLYLSGKLHLLDSRGEVWKSFIVMVPSLGAALVAGSRIMDARHHPFDVITGSLLGIFVGWTSYRQYFPSLSNFRAKGRAYPIRTWGRISEDYQTVHNDGFQDTRPLHKPEETVQSGFEPTRTPPGSNVFRDEIHSSQRRRQGSIRGTSSSTYSAEPSIPPIPRVPAGANPVQFTPSNNPFAQTGSRHQSRRDDWDDSSDEETTDLELQPTYTLSQPRGPGHYEGAHNPFNEQETAYKAPPAGPSIHSSGATVEHHDGDLGSSDSVPPLVPPHGQFPSRGVELYDGPPR